MSITLILSYLFGRDIMIQIDPKTRLWIANVLIGIGLIVLTVTKTIPYVVYKPYIEPFIGAYIYHLIRSLGYNLK